jgi:hypothetical protein
MSCETNHAEIHKNLEAGPKYRAGNLPSMSCETNHAEIHKNLEAGPKYSTSTLKFQ